jgi:hypothetical protein
VDQEPARKEDHEHAASQQAADLWGKPRAELKGTSNMRVVLEAPSSECTNSKSNLKQRACQWPFDGARLLPNNEGY